MLGKGKFNIYILHLLKIISTTNSQIMAFIIVRYPAWNMGLHIQYLISQDSKLTTYYIFQRYIIIAILSMSTIGHYHLQPCYSQCIFVKYNYFQFSASRYIFTTFIYFHKYYNTHTILALPPTLK